MSPHPSLNLVACAEEVAATHDALTLALRQLQGTTDPVEASEILRRLRITLPAHFSYEEQRDGVFDWVLALTPEQGDRVRGLVEAHRRLEAECEALTPMFDDEGRPDPAALARLCTFAAHLSAHEMEESLAILVARSRAAD